jgi:signal peptidase I
MAAYKRFFPNLQSAFSIVIMITVWIAFAPTQVGGLAAYVIVIGNSMEPKFHIGDLIIAHRELTYEVGDAIVYQNPQLKSFVFHRVIAQESGHYILKGDNNSWVDTYQPAHEEVIGKLWLHLPRGGLAIQKIRSPFAMAVIAGVAGAVFATSLFANKARGNKRMNSKSMREWFTSIQLKIQDRLKTTNNPKPQNLFTISQAEVFEGSFFVLGLIAFSALVLGIIAFSRPTSRIKQDDLNYEHIGVFSYSAAAPQGVYDTDTIKSGDPIFAKLTCAVDVNFQYTLVAAQAKDLAGTYQLTAIISEQMSGWQRSIPLQAEASFSGTAFGTAAKLDLCGIQSLTKSLEAKTDSHAGSYTLVVTPNIKLNGEIAGRLLESTFKPALTFRADPIQFYLLRSEEQENPLVFAEIGTLRKEFSEANTMQLFGREFAIPALRLAALVGLIGSLLGLILLGRRLQHLSQVSKDKFFQIKYTATMIDIEGANVIESSSLIDVTSMDALAKLAERFNAMILHAEHRNLHAYYVQAGGTTYRFRMETTNAGKTNREAEMIGQEIRS